MTLLMRVGADGGVREAAILRSSDPAFESSAPARVRTWRSHLALCDGTPVAGESVMTVRFRVR